MRLEELARVLSCSLDGDPGIEITGVAGLKDAGPGDISFYTNPKYHSALKSTRASALIVGLDFPRSDIPLIHNENPYLTFAKALEIFHPQPEVFSGIHPTAWIEESARIGNSVSVGAFSYVGRETVIGDGVIIGPRCTINDKAVIGDHTYLHSSVVVRERVRIGSNCIIQDNAVIGSDGFGFARQEDGSYYKIVQSGTVIIEDEVEIGAGTTIDRSSIGETRIGKGTKIDNLVQVGHGCEIGRHCLICAQVGLAGSTKIGDYVILAGQVGSAGHLRVGDRAIVTAKSGIPRDVDPGKVISGIPAFDNKTWLKSVAIIPLLPELYKDVRRLIARILELEKSLK